MSRTDQGKMKGRRLTGSTQKTATLLVTGMQGELKSFLGKISAAQRQSRFVEDRSYLGARFAVRVTSCDVTHTNLISV